jgi:hypothetical protein
VDAQIGRNLTDAFTGFLRGKEFLIMDRNSSFHAAFHEERSHQGLDGQIITAAQSIGFLEGKLQQRERLGGMLNYYYFEAA